MNHFYADIHCHPSLKPYGKSFDRSPAGQNNNNRRDENSVWFYDSANLPADEIVNQVFSSNVQAFMQKWFV